MNRIERPDLKALIMKSKRIVLKDDQMFCSTKGAFEIWDKEPLRMVYRIQRRYVLWEIGHCPEI